jgi:two-component system, cell cycle sensor histidine kinase and response regulator CckA
VTLVDITERRDLEAQLHQSQKMDAIGRLAGGVAHDFNNMLAVINGYTDLILARPELDPSTGQYLGEVRKAGERAADLTRQLLAFSRKQMIAPRLVDLNELLTGTHKLLRRLIGEDVELVTLLDPGLSRVKVDPGQMQQVLVNLAVNARDAMPRGGKLTVQTRNATLRRATRHLPSGAYVEILVSDTGSGMSEETLAHVFEPFFTTKEVGEGTGLGLATVYGILKQSAGHIEVSSEPGVGTTFRLLLPRAAEAAHEEPSPTPDAGPAGTETVLVVEDEHMVRGLVRSVLEGSGYRVLEAMNGDEALHVCARHGHEIDLLLTDIVMPGTGGRDLVERLAPRYPEMRVLFMSGYTDDAILRQGVTTSTASFIQKPFSPVALARKVRELLDA